MMFNFEATVEDWKEVVEDCETAIRLLRKDYYANGVSASEQFRKFKAKRQVALRKIEELDGLNTLGADMAEETSAGNMKPSHEGGLATMKMNPSLEGGVYTMKMKASLEGDAMKMIEEGARAAKIEDAARVARNKDETKVDIDKALEQAVIDRKDGKATKAAAQKAAIFARKKERVRKAAEQRAAGVVRKGVDGKVEEPSSEDEDEYETAVSGLEEEEIEEEECEAKARAMVFVHLRKVAPGIAKKDQVETLNETTVKDLLDKIASADSHEKKTVAQDEYVKAGQNDNGQDFEIKAKGYAFPKNNEKVKVVGNAMKKIEEGAGAAKDKNDVRVARSKDEAKVGVDKALEQATVDEKDTAAKTEKIVNDESGEAVNEKVNKTVEERVGGIAKVEAVKADTIAERPFRDNGKSIVKKYIMSGYVRVKVDELDGLYVKYAKYKYVKTKADNIGEEYFKVTDTKKAGKTAEDREKDEAKVGVHQIRKCGTGDAQSVSPSFKSSVQNVEETEAFAAESGLSKSTVRAEIMYRPEYGADRHTYSGTCEVDSAKGAGVHKQPGRPDILERVSCVERLFKDVFRVEEPDGLKSSKNYANIVRNNGEVVGYGITHNISGFRLLIKHLRLNKEREERPNSV